MAANVRYLSLVLALVAIGPVLAQPTTYAFDTVTAVELDEGRPSISGIEKDSGVPISVSFIDSTNISYRYVVNRCVPMFLTAIEKPGRYYLFITIDPSESSVQLRSCRLELKS